MFTDSILFQAIGKSGLMNDGEIGLKDAQGFLEKLKSIVRVKGFLW